MMRRSNSESSSSSSSSSNRDDATTGSSPSVSPLKRPRSSRRGQLSTALNIDYAESDYPEDNQIRDILRFIDGMSPLTGHTFSSHVKGMVAASSSLNFAGLFNLDERTPTHFVGEDEAHFQGRVDIYQARASLALQMLIKSLHRVPSTDPKKVEWMLLLDQHSEFRPLLTALRNDVYRSTPQDKFRALSNLFNAPQGPMSNVAYQALHRQHVDYFQNVNVTITDLIAYAMLNNLHPRFESVKSYITNNPNAITIQKIFDLMEAQDLQQINAVSDSGSHSGYSAIGQEDPTSAGSQEAAYYTRNQECHICGDPTHWKAQCPYQHHYQRPPVQSQHQHPYQRPPVQSQPRGGRGRSHPTYPRGSPQAFPPRGYPPQAPRPPAPPAPRGPRFVSFAPRDSRGRGRIPIQYQNHDYHAYNTTHNYDVDDGASYAYEYDDSYAHDDHTALTAVAFDDVTKLPTDVYPRDISFHTQNALMAGPSLLPSPNKLAFVVDSGASTSLANMPIDSMQNPVPRVVNINTASSQSITSTHIGHFGDLPNVLRVPSISHNLLSVSQVCKDSAQVSVFTATDVGFYNAQNVFVTADPTHCGCERNGLYLLDIDTNDRILQADPHDTHEPDAWANLTSTLPVNRFERWHIRMAHMGVAKLKKLRDLYPDKVIFSNHEVKTFQQKFCKGCNKGKMLNPSVPRALAPANRDKYRRGEYLSVDVAVSNVVSHDGFAYQLVAIDACTRYEFDRYFHKKSDAANALLSILQEIERAGITIKGFTKVEHDPGGEFASHLGIAALEELGVTNIELPPEEHSKLAERTNRTNAEVTRSFIEQARANLAHTTKSRPLWGGNPYVFWPEAARHAVTINNMLPCADDAPADAKKSGSPIPSRYELWHGKPPDLSRVRAFGCLVAVKLHDSEQKKYKSKSVEGIFLGYDPDSPHSYRYFDLTTGAIKNTCKIVFDENFRPPQEDTIKIANWTASQLKDVQAMAANKLTPDSFRATLQALIDQQKTLFPYWVLDLDEPEDEEFETPSANLAQYFTASLDSNARIVHTLPIVNAATLSQANAPPQGDQEVETAAPSDLTSREEPLPRYFPHVPIAKLLSPDTSISLSSSSSSSSFSNPISVAHFADIDPACPLTYQQATNGAHASKWRASITEEYQSLTSNRAFKIVRRTRGMHVLGSRLLFKIKSDGRYKTRWVIRGDQQKEGIDYDETFAPVVRYTTLRTMLAKAAATDMLLESMDVDTAFLYGELDDGEDVFTTLPPDFELPVEFAGVPRSDLCCKLLKSVYGLKQAPRKWNQKLDSTLKSIGFSQSLHDSCLYYLIEADTECFLSIFVDDIVIAASTAALMQRVKSLLSSKFKMKDLGPLSKVLGINVTRDISTGIVHLHMADYIDALATKFSVRPPTSSSRVPISPMEDRLHLRPSEDTPPAWHYEYRSAIGALMYLMTSCRPDIAFAVGYLARFMTCYGSEHYQALDRLLAYVVSTPFLGIKYGITKDLTLLAYCDADWGGDSKTLRSTSGYIFYLAGGPISWKSRVQPSVTLSSAESEYVCLTLGAQEGTYLRFICGDLRIQQYSIANPDPVNIYEDNMAAIAMSYNPVNHDRSKHILIKQHFIREQIANHTVTLSHIPTQYQLADLLTKPVSNAIFSRLVSPFMGHSPAPWPLSSSTISTTSTTKPTTTTAFSVIGSQCNQSSFHQKRKREEQSVATGLSSLQSSKHRWLGQRRY